MEVSGDGKHVCNECGYSSKVKRDVVRHLRIHTGERPYKCSLCEKAFATPGNRNSHQLTHSGEKRFQCDVCMAKFSAGSSLAKHKRFHTGENMHECQLCGKKYTEKGHLEGHMVTHTGKKSFFCPIPTCTKGFGTKNRLDKHLRRRRGCYTCCKCGEVLSSFQLVEEHSKTHIGLMKIQCSICKEEFLDGLYDLHMKENHPAENPYNCKVCHEKFKTNYQLKKHTIMTHSSRKPYHCSKCNRKVAGKTTFRRHILQHGGEFFYCPICNIGFVSKSDFDEHWEIHPGKAFTCDVCQEVFLSGNALKGHKDIHLSGNNVQDMPGKYLCCPFCETCFTMKLSLKRHLKKKHFSTEFEKGDDEGAAGSQSVAGDFPCSICYKSFSLQKSLLWHEVFIHGSVRLVQKIDKKADDVNFIEDIVIKDESLEEFPCESLSNEVQKIDKKADDNNDIEDIVIKDESLEEFPCESLSNEEDNGGKGVELLGSVIYVKEENADDDDNFISMD